MEDGKKCALGEIIGELEKLVPEDVRKDLLVMSMLQARITSRIRDNKAISEDDIKTFNIMCYKHFGKVQDGTEFRREAKPTIEKAKEPPKKPAPVTPLARHNDDPNDWKAADIVRNYVIDHLDKSTPLPVSFETFIVWKSKVLQNWKWLLSTTLPDGMYYELTYNGDKREYYLDAYRKVENKVVRGGAPDGGNVQ